ncbi:hypothetical protein HanRHA438_Chr06g0287531 [Helianthus annuus]|uniref:Uncharacterized protein n=1 Tax=Helianthus annuus TaxID=4232 RepID=A0A9K3IW23_HELAN|nr:hypothetical protein HanXRQr2_Chr06g0278361 [Helianthus annuus]KAJ0545942.1 hypothetical protein HanIR_Chr08g0355351 [Helianthus annuus]KAJ0552781.1 hypothetical protein HanHA89_Chr08g0288971 [Helianthus annuus]KAJ0561914.1 hypothetical protein HanHA300_Chr06g0228391 [Helianthus annuus]KAJ0574979.1 hypothetical protein HanHA89_Chr06g0244341 [Helianthus annuus]
MKMCCGDWLLSWKRTSGAWLFLRQLQLKTNSLALTTLTSHILRKYFEHQNIYFLENQQNVQKSLEKDT